MNTMWFFTCIQSSIGKKLIMAGTGLLLLLFLALHAFGNAAIYMGSKYFQAYADALHGFPVLVLLFGLGLIAVFSAHIGFGLLLFFEKRQTTSRYHVQTRVVKNSFASRTMPYTGLLILLFLIVHVFGFGIAKPEHVPISMVVKDYFSSVFYGLFYIFSFAVLAVHLSHGFWSMLQTFGINHPRYTTLIGKLTYVVPALFFLLFTGIPLYFMCIAGV
jgi:succinate dehydrogenase / fumarate reductase cytochrome b subunit